MRGSKIAPNAARNDAESRYIVSRYLSTPDPGSGTLVNSATGAEIELSEEALKVLALFRSACSWGELESKLKVGESQKNKKKLRDFFDQLVSEQIIVPYPESTELTIPSIASEDMLVVGSRPPLTMFGVPGRSIRAIEHGSIVFVGAPFDLGATGHPGARLAPDRLRTRSGEIFQYQADIFTGLSKGWHSLDRGKVILEGLKLVDVGNVLHLVGEGYDCFFRRLERVVAALLEGGAFPVVIGGDHSCSIGVVRALARKHSIGILHLDAHADLGDLIEGVPNNHGNVFTRILKEGLVTSLYQFGLRGVAPVSELSKQSTSYPLRRVKDGVEDAAGAVDPSQKYYLSIDIDVLDPAVAPGTGTPAPNGMSIDLLVELIRTLARRVDIVGMDLVEVNPLVDVRDITSDIALEVVLECLSSWFSGPERGTS